MDDDTTISLSENFKPTGILLLETRCNRGWGAVVKSFGVAEYFREVFTVDISDYDICPYVIGTEPFPDSWRDKEIMARFSVWTIHHAEVPPVISLGTSSLITLLIQNAAEKIDLQQAYISNYPKGAHNIWLDYVFDAGGRGISVRVMLDGIYYNTDGDADNDEIVANINRISRNEGILAQTWLLLPDEYLTKLHSKGMMVDMKYVLISSVNWNYNSPNNNREVGIISNSDDAASYFSEVFQFDWEGDSDKLKIGVSTRVDLRLILVAGIVVLLIVIWRLRVRR